MTFDLPTFANVPQGTVTRFYNHLLDADLTPNDMLEDYPDGWKRDIVDIFIAHEFEGTASADFDGEL